MKNPITVEGYTDNVPTQGERYVSNWELSAARATAVVRGFVDIGIEPERLAAVGYGEYHPVATNATPEGREKNRRVTIIVARDADVQRGLTALSATRSKPVPLLWEDEAGAAETQDSDSSDSVSAIRREGGGLLFTAPAAERENHSNDKNQGR